MISFEHVLSLQSQPSPFKGVLCYPHGTTPTLKLKDALTWLQRSIRLGDQAQIEECILLHCYNGFFLDVIETIKKSVFFEEVGLGNSALLVLVQKINHFFQTIKWPLSEKVLAKSIYYLLELGNQLGQAKKSRIVASYAHISLLALTKKPAGPEEEWSVLLHRFKKLTKRCLKLRKTTDDDNEFLLSPSVKKLMRHIAECFFVTKRMKQPKLMAELWTHLPQDDDIVQAAKIISQKELNRISLHFATLVFVLRTDTTENTIFGQREKRYRSLEDPNLQKHCSASLRAPDPALVQHEFHDAPDQDRCLASQEADTLLRQYLGDLCAVREAECGKSTTRPFRLIDDACKRWNYHKIKRSAAQTDRPAPKKRKYPTVPPPFPKNPVAQLLSGARKKYITVFETRVLKGPYVEADKKDMSTMKMIQQNTKNIRAIDTKRMLGYATVSTCKMVVEDGATYLEFPNLGDLNTMQVETQSNRFAQDVQVAKKGTLISRISDYRNPKCLSEDVLAMIVNHQYIRYVLAVGGCGLQNLLLQTAVETEGEITGHVYGVGLGEKRIFKETPSSRLEMLFGRNPHHGDFWEKQLKYVVQLDASLVKKLPNPVQIRCQNFAEKE